MWRRTPARRSRAVRGVPIPPASGPCDTIGHMDLPTDLIAIDGGQTSVKVAARGLTTEYPGLRTNAPLTPQLLEDITKAVDAVAHPGPFTVAIGTTGLTSLESDPAPLLELVKGRGVSKIILAHDSVTSYIGAIGYRAGVVCAAGTGVVTLAAGKDSLARVDGWGNLMGDVGSGYWIGRAGLEAVMRAFDGRGPSTALTPYVQQKWPDLTEAYIPLQADRDKVRVIASFCRIIAELASTDEVCAGICQAAGRELACSITAALTRTHQTDAAAPLVCLIGSVFKSQHVTNACLEALHENWPGLQPTEPAGVGIDGAIELAGLPADNPLFSAIRVAEV